MHQQTRKACMDEVVNFNKRKDHKSESNVQTFHSCKVIHRIAFTYYFKHLFCLKHEYQSPKKEEDDWNHPKSLENLRFQWNWQSRVSLVEYTNQIKSCAVSIWGKPRWSLVRSAFKVNQIKSCAISIRGEPRWKSCATSIWGEPSQILCQPASEANKSSLVPTSIRGEPS